MKQKLSRRTIWQIVLVILVLVIFGGYVFWDVHFNGPLMQLFNSRDMIFEYVNKAGVLGPSLYVLLQFLQTVIAPIPGGATGPIGGFLFGWGGVVWTLIGTSFGAFFIFWLAKKFGRSLVLKIMNKKTFTKFDVIPEEKAEMAVFSLFLIPGLPDDAIAYLAGMTKIPIGRLVIFWIVGRLPSVIVANMIGMGFEQGNLGTVGIFIGIAAVAVGFVAIKHEAIITFVQEKWGRKKKKQRQS